MAAELTAQEILDKSKAAMAPPIQYRMKCGGVESVVSTGRAADGTVATRSDAIIAGRPRNSLMLSHETYEWYPQTKVIIDTSKIQKDIMDRAAQMKTALEGRTIKRNVVLAGTVTRNGKPAYVIEERWSDESAAKAPLPAGTALPGGTQSVIDKETFLLLETRNLTVAPGATNGEISYSGHDKNPTFPRDLFLPPDGYEVKKPNSRQEYTAIIFSQIESPGARPPGRPAPTIPVSPQKLGPVVIDPDTGKAIAPVPPGMTRKQFDLLTAPKAGVNDAPPLDQTPADLLFRRIALLLMLLLSGVVIIVYLAHRMAKSAHGASAT